MVQIDTLKDVGQEAVLCIFVFARCVYKEHPMPEGKIENPNLCLFNTPTSAEGQNQSWLCYLFWPEALSGKYSWKSKIISSCVFEVVWCVIMGF